MSDYSFEVIGSNLIDKYVERCENATAFINEVATETLTALKPDLLKELQEEPGAPLQLHGWTSDAQRAYVMIRVRKGIIKIPYARSREKGEGVSVSWDVLLKRPSQGVIHFTVINTSPAYQFVEGEDQQVWHANTGWLYAPAILAKQVKFIIEAIREDLGIVWRNAKRN